MTSERRKIRYAVVGAGNIAQVAVLPAFAHAKDNSELVALVSGDPEKRAALGERYSLEANGDYDAFEQVLERAAVDAVYVATPNALHKEFALRAIARGVHVLCEKPLAPSVADCQEMHEASATARVKLMVAYRLHFEEATLAALDVVRSGKLGQVRLFSSFFSQVVRPGDIRQDPKLGGGAVYDLGVYCINAARNLFDAEPTTVVAEFVEQNGIDTTTSAILRFPGDRIAEFCLSASAARVSSYRVAGSEGDLRVEPAYDYTGELVHYLTLGDEVQKTTYRRGDQFAPEIKYFSDCILHDLAPEPSLEEGLCDIRVVEAILESGRSHRAIELPPHERRRRPSSAQADHERPVKKQETVNAPGPALR
jgi:predicted dehydrogenase